MYQKGDGIEKNEWQAAEMYKMAAEKGDATAQRNLGWLYYEGKGVQKNMKEAAKWFQKAAEQGDENAKSQLDYMSIVGEL